MDTYDRDYDGWVTGNIAKGTVVPMCEMRNIETTDTRANDLEGFIVADDVSMEEEDASDDEEEEYEWNEGEETDEEEEEYANWE